MITEQHINYLFKAALIGLLLAIVCIIFHNSPPRLLVKGVSCIVNFAAIGGDQDRWRRINPLTDVALSLKNMIPEDACVTVSNEKPMEYQTFKFYLYPVRISDAEANEFNNTPRSCRERYFIDLHGQIANPPRNWQGVDLLYGTRIFLIDGARLYPSREPDRIGIGAIARFFIFNFLVLATGLCLMVSLLPSIKNMPFGGKISCSFLLGLVAMTLPFLFLFLSGVPLTDGLVVFMSYGIFLISYFFMCKKQSNLLGIFCSMPGPSRRNYIWDFVLLLILAYFTLYIIAFPVAIIDEVHIWLLKARIFYHTRTADLSYLEYTNTYYPLLWPLNLALQSIFAGGEYEQFAKWTSAGIFLSSIGLIKFLGFQLGMGRRLSWVPVIFFLFFFFHWTFFTALPENIFIALLIMATALLIYWRNEGEVGAFFLCILALTGLVGVKFEGSIVVIIFIIAFLFSEKIVTQGLSRRFKVALLLAMPLILHMSWLLWLNLRPVPYSIFHMSHEFSFHNIYVLLRMAVYFLTRPQTFLILILIRLSILYTANDRKWSSHERFLSLIIAGMLIFSYIAGLRWPTKDIFLYYAEVMTRLCSRAMPLFVLLWMSRILVGYSKEIDE